MQHLNGSDIGSPLPRRSGRISANTPACQSEGCGEQIGGEYFVGHPARFWQAQTLSSGGQDGTRQESVAIRFPLMSKSLSMIAGMWQAIGSSDLEPMTVWAG